VLDEGVDFKRRVVENLRPTLLDNMGLLAALRWVSQDTCSRAGLSYTECYPEEEPLLAEEVSILAFRLVQEALTNVVKHAHATDVRIEVGNNDRQLTVLVEDNGIGIEHDPSASTAVHGLALMRLRVTNLGGSLEIGSGERGGTVVQARLPSQGVAASTRAAAADRPAASRRASGI
jgi:signal transduction histidine kinase